MTVQRRRRNMLIAIAVLVIAILLLLSRCLPKKPAVPVPDTGTTLPASATAAALNARATSEPAAPEPEEVLTPATLTVPAKVLAGATFAVTWTGPDNRGDYVTIVASEAAANDYGNYRETRDGVALELTAPMDSGVHEVRYVTGRSHTILGRATVEVVPVGATLDAVDEITLGAKFSVTWTGPNNKGDYITIVPTGAPDEHYGSYVDTDKGSPLTLTAPTNEGDAEIRYVTGQDKKVLARRPIRVLMADVILSAPEEAIAGSTIQVTWTGPDNAGDYITVVPSETPDGQYGNYTDTSKGSPLNLLMPIMAGGAQLRYMTGQGGRVLNRRPITIVAAEVTLSAPSEGGAGTTVSVMWTGPNNSGDYITVVVKDTPDGQYGDYTATEKGSPLSVKLPKEAGDAEVRYMSGQGNKVLARIPIKVVP
jgi:Ca-activated chloride channel homolog